MLASVSILYFCAPKSVEYTSCKGMVQSFTTVCASAEWEPKFHTIECLGERTYDARLNILPTHTGHPNIAFEGETLILLQGQQKHPSMDLCNQSYMHACTSMATPMVKHNQEGGGYIIHFDIDDANSNPLMKAHWATHVNHPLCLFNACLMTAQYAISSS